MELPAVLRTQPITKRARISCPSHVQLLQWLHSKQQQKEIKFSSVSVLAASGASITKV